ncbi:MAG: hypothetical protein RR692_05865, partial [Raoultibacter sp.]
GSTIAKEPPLKQKSLPAFQSDTILGQIFLRPLAGYPEEQSPKPSEMRIKPSYIVLETNKVSSFYL